MVPLTVMEHTEGSCKGEVAHNIEAEEVEPGGCIDRFARCSGNDPFELMGDVYHS